MSGMAQAHSVELIAFRVGGQLLGVPVGMVQEVLAAQRITRVPMARPEVAGLLNLRGQIVTAVDVRACLGLPPRDDGIGAMHVVARDRDELFSLVVDEVRDVIAVSADTFDPPPPTLAPRWREVCERVYRLDNELLVSISVPALLALH